jgi:hypothetical protein
MNKKNVTVLVVVAAGIALVIAGMLYSGSGIPKETAELPTDMAQEANNVDSFGNDLAALRGGDVLLDEVHGSLAETADGSFSALDASAITNEAASADFSQDLADLKQSDTELTEISGGLNTIAQ